jgi:hypothetical protein
MTGDIDASQWKVSPAKLHPTSLISEMQELETVLARRAGEALGVEIKRGLPVTGFHQTGDGLLFSQATNLLKVNGSWAAMAPQCCPQSGRF